MGYPPDLEEVSIKRLEQEILRRRELHEKGKCPYCSQPYTSHACKFSGREEHLYARPGEKRS